MSEHINISESEGLTGICLTQKERKESQAQEVACRGAVPKGCVTVELRGVPWWQRWVWEECLSLGFGVKLGPDGKTI